MSDLPVVPRPILRVEGLHKSYRMGDSDLHVLKGIDLEVREGEILAIMGPSGAGKSTLLHLLGNLDRPSRGRVYLHNTDLASLSEDSAATVRNRKFGFVFQFFHLVPELTVLENVAMAAMIGTSTFAWPVARWAAYGRARRILARLGMAHRLDSVPNQLSGGERQRVAIARALMNDPEVIFCDEPTGNLDQATATEIQGVLRKLSRELGKTLVIVTHDERIAEGAHRIVRLFDGKVAEVQEREALSPPVAGSGAEPWAAAADSGAAPKTWSQRISLGLVLSAAFLGWMTWTWGRSVWDSYSAGESPLWLVALSAVLAGLAGLGCLLARDFGRRVGVFAAAVAAGAYGAPLVAEALRTASETWVLSVGVELRFLVALAWLFLLAGAAFARGREKAALGVGASILACLATLGGAALRGGMTLALRPNAGQGWVAPACLLGVAVFVECVLAVVLARVRGWYACIVLLPFLAVTAVASAAYVFVRAGSRPALLDCAMALGGLLFIGFLGSPVLRKRLRA